MDLRRRRLRDARLYLVCDIREDALIEAALRGGVDIVQLRAKQADDAALVTTGRRYAARCAAHGALFILNDRPDLVGDAQADGVHIGQDDRPVAEARALIGPERIVGLSTHTPEQITTANASDVDYIGVGPVHATPTKLGRPAVGTTLVREAAAHAVDPFFAIGGVDTMTVDAVREAGAERIAVVRAITEAADPEAAARALRAAICAGGREAGVAGRSRKRGRHGTPRPATHPAPRGRELPSHLPPPRESRSEARNAEIRATLRPYRRGERPRIVLASTGIAAALALANLVSWLAGLKISGHRPAASGILIFSALLLACAAGLWRMRAGAVLAFMCLMAIIAILFSLFLIEASNLLGVVVALAIILVSGYLFFKLVRVLSRLQAPREQ